MMNSSICPPVDARVAAYMGRSYMRPLMLPGYGEKPSGPLASPSVC